MGRFSQYPESGPSLKVRVKNFQSIGDASLEVRGLTVITGPSSIGKSALVRAIAGAFFGIPGDHAIKRGNIHLGVVIEDPTMQVVWRKTNKPSPGKPTALQVNGKIHTKLGRDHAELTQETMVREIHTQATSLRPQIAGQHDGPFLLNLPETTAAEVLRQLSRTDVVTEAQVLASRDRRGLETQRKVLVEEQLRLDTELTRTDDVAAQRTVFIQTKLNVLVLSAKEVVLRELRTKLSYRHSLKVPPQTPPLPELPPEPPQQALRRVLIERGEQASVVMNMVGVATTLDLEAESVQARMWVLEEAMKKCPTCGKVL